MREYLASGVAALRPLELAAAAREMVVVRSGPRRRTRRATSSCARSPSR